MWCPVVLTLSVGLEVRAGQASDARADAAVWAGARDGLYLSLDDQPADVDAAYRNAVQLERGHRADAEAAAEVAVRSHRAGTSPGRAGRWAARPGTVAYARAVDAFAEAVHLAQQGGILLASRDDYRRTVGRP